jgi:hypothetical protein
MHQRWMRVSNVTFVAAASCLGSTDPNANFTY